MQEDLLLEIIIVIIITFTLKHNIKHHNIQGFSAIYRSPDLKKCYNLNEDKIKQFSEKPAVFLPM